MPPKMKRLNEALLYNKKLRVARVQQWWRPRSKKYSKEFTSAGRRAAPQAARRLWRTGTTGWLATGFAGCVEGEGETQAQAERLTAPRPLATHATHASSFPAFWFSRMARIRF